MTAFAGLRARLIKLMDVGSEQEKRQPIELAHRFRFARVMLFVVAPMFYVYAVHFMVTGMLVGAAFMLFGGVTTTVATILYAKILKGSTARLILTVVSISVLAALILKDAAVIWANGRLDYVVWTFFYPLLAFYLLGARRGFYAVLGMTAVLAIILFVPGPGLPPHVDVNNLKIQYGISFLSIITGAYIYERTRMQAQAELIAKQERLQESENRLHETIDALRSAKARSEQLAVQADKANKAKSVFLAGMSHELRTPLNHIIGFTDLLMEGVGGTLTDVQREYLGDVASSGRHLLSLITDILDLSKVEAGKLKIRPANVNVSELLERSLLMVKDRALRHGIDTSIDCREPPAAIVADERMMRQILYNLLSNAVKFTPDGGRVTLVCSARAGDGDRALVAVDVVDTGIGLHAEDLERIFSPFEQVDTAPSAAREGTGLGLALTRRMVELHGGRIWAHSEGLGKGSTFHVTLPVEPGPGG